MKKTLFIVLVVLFVFAFTVPALASDSGHECEHSGATISDLRACITHAWTMGHITNRGIAQSLFSKLDNAQALLDAGQPIEAVKILNALINEIEAQSGKFIDPQHAAHMIAHTQRVIDALS